MAVLTNGCVAHVREHRLQLERKRARQYPCRGSMSVSRRWVNRVSCEPTLVCEVVREVRGTVDEVADDNATDDEAEEGQ